MDGGDRTATQIQALLLVSDFSERHPQLLPLPKKEEEKGEGKWEDGGKEEEEERLIRKKLPGNKSPGLLSPNLCTLYPPETPWPVFLREHTPDHPVALL